MCVCNFFGNYSELMLRACADETEISERVDIGRTRCLLDILVELDSIECLEKRLSLS